MRSNTGTEHDVKHYRCDCHDGWRKEEDRFHKEPCNVEIKCEPYTFTEGMIGDGCTNEIVLGAALQTSCNVTCSSAYRGIGGDPVVRCGSNGGQALTAFECEERTCEDDETDCGDHSVCSNKNNDDGYECSCADGFSGDSVMNQPAVCLPDPCDTFFTVSHGSHGCLNLPSGEECSVICDEGYTVSGGNVTCYAGSFTNIPTCEPNPCIDTPSIFGADPSAMSCGDSTCGVRARVSVYGVACRQCYVSVYGVA